MVEMICIKSGLKFEAENRRTKTHPEIAFYTQHKNWDYRYFALAVIKKGKEEGWSTVEKFKQEIESEWEKHNQSGEPEELEEKAELECWHYVAKITGTHQKYRFVRDFLIPEKEELRKSGSKYRYYDLSNLEDGIYEFNYRSAKRNDTRSYAQVKNGEKTDLDLEQVEQIFPELEDPKSKATLTLKQPEYNTFAGCFEKEGQIYFVLEREYFAYDEDGILEEVDVSRHAEFTNWYCIKATEEQIEKYNATKEQATKEYNEKLKIQEERTYWKDFLKKAQRLELEENPQPQGTKIVIHENYSGIHDYVLVDYDSKIVWAVYYNGRDGDDWSYSNYLGDRILVKYRLI